MRSMKFVLFLSIICSAAAANAQVGACTSGTWLYQAYNVCAAGGAGPDLSRPISRPYFQELVTEWQRGSKDQVTLCSKLRDSFNVANAPRGLRAELTQPSPVSELNNGNRAYMQYKYTCGALVYQYEVQPVAGVACGLGQVQLINRSTPVVPNSGKLSCLTCENLDHAAPEALVSCMRENAVSIMTSDVALDAASVDRLTAKVRNILNLYQGRTSNLRSYADAQPFMDLLERYKR